jgi:CRP-like cAMP-binding protein
MKGAKYHMGPKTTPKSPFHLKDFLTKANGGKSGKTSAEYRADTDIFVQGDTADSIFYIKSGKVKLTVVSKQGKEAVVGILNEGDFFGEGCLAGQQVRMATAVALSDCSIMKFEKAAVVKLLHDEPTFSELFVAHLLSRNIKIEEDLVDQRFNSSEKRLARVLLGFAPKGAIMASPARGMEPKESAPAAIQDRVDSNQIITALANEYWQRRGCPIGSPELDWFKAEGDVKNWLQAEGAPKATLADCCSGS